MLIFQSCLSFSPIVEVLFLVDFPSDLRTVFLLLRVHELVEILTEPFIFVVIVIVSLKAVAHGNLIELIEEILYQLLDTVPIIDLLAHTLVGPLSVQTIRLTFYLTIFKLLIVLL